MRKAVQLAHYLSHYDEACARRLGSKLDALVGLGDIVATVGVRGGGFDHGDLDQDACWEELDLGLARMAAETLVALAVGGFTGCPWREVPGMRSDVVGEAQRVVDWAKLEEERMWHARCGHVYDPIDNWVFHHADDGDAHDTEETRSFLAALARLRSSP